MHGLWEKCVWDLCGGGRCEAVLAVCHAWVLNWRMAC
jgi:hypothetical protein